MISVFNLFSIGVGPSSSHTVGPMKAAHEFVMQLKEKNLLSEVTRIQVDLYGSLALTGKGHGTDVAILNGLEGQWPKTVVPENIVPRAKEIVATKKINIAGAKDIEFISERDLLFHQKELLPLHTNGMRFSAFNHDQKCISKQIYYSVGGGFIVTEEQFGKALPAPPVPYPFKTAVELFEQCQKHQLKIHELMFANEQALDPKRNIKKDLLEIASIMEECIEKGCHSTEEVLPGGINVQRRAPRLYKKLNEKGFPDTTLWPTVFAMAVNEENAAGGRVVTAPTNGAAGIIPSVLTYFRRYHPEANDDAIANFLLTAGAIAILYKTNASISGAEVGCQGEVGVACSMAAGALTAVLNGSLEQIENAAEMAMEHHLGMTCDPIAGLVQVPCIERNGVASEKAIKLTYLALLEDGKHKKVSLDKVIATMFQTGKDMMSIYKETSLGGLAANVPEC